jgi:putative ABC transport system substrate-binding protein
MLEVVPSPPNNPLEWTADSHSPASAAHRDVRLRASGSVPVENGARRTGHLADFRVDAVISRRALVAGCVALVTTPFAVESQPGGKIYRIGTLTRGGREAAAPYNRALEEGLGVLGWVAGRNVAFEHRYADLKPERYAELASELVRLGVDVVVAPSTPAALAVRQATRTIPIVTTSAVDPVGAGLVRSLARPGGNVTGLTSDTGPAIGAKLLQLLKEAVPKATRAVVLSEPAAQPGTASYVAAMEKASGSVGIALSRVDVREPGDMDRAFAAIVRERPHALVVAAGTMAITHARTIAEFAIRNRLPTVARVREFAEAGGLMTYSTDLVDLYRRAAIHIDKILKGTKPSDLPIEQPTKFELAINVKTAMALGLPIPGSLLARADLVIER